MLFYVEVGEFYSEIWTQTAPRIKWNGRNKLILNGEVIKGKSWSSLGGDQLERNPSVGPGPNWAPYLRAVFLVERGPKSRAFAGFFSCRVL